jgi:hypothetical protein
MSARKYFLTPGELHVIKDYYDGSTLRLNKIMRLLGSKYPRWHVQRKAAELGLAKPKPAVWSEKEEEWLHENFPRKGYQAIQASLRRINGGIWRSPCAILLKAKRLHINKRSNGLTMRMMEDILGQDHKTISTWIERGLLTATRKGTARTEIQGGDMWHFEPKKVRDFIIANPEKVDLRRVEPVSFIHLVAGMME